LAVTSTDTPWDEPTEHSPEFVEYVRGNLWAIEPWSRLHGDVQGQPPHFDPAFDPAEDR
jgi:hypothetical protein